MAAQKIVHCFQWDILEHPSCRPDLAPSDYHLIAVLKEHLGGHGFQGDDRMGKKKKS
jgi:hypothetical protein